ncbi:PilW family protein [Photobacterium minamisatsumaniensis]|uniref:PilW family protein n=1 Tax=Photobacterium minamisatsumaniensis TaxID=2910233 RepID=UPI003D0F9157
MGSFKRMQQGFTLMEMVIALVILAIISLAIGSYLQLGAQGYIGTVNRDRAQSIARFALEKMTREIRHAAPNSVEVNSPGRCLSFYPVKLSGFYLAEPINTALDFSPTVGSVDEWTTIQSNAWMAVGLPSAKQYDEKRNTIRTVEQSSDDGVLTATLALPLTSSSPANRLYSYSEKVSYCFDSTTNELHRLVDNMLPSKNTLIAQDVQAVSFASEGVGMNSNGMVHIGLVIQREQTGELSNYEHSVQVINVL